MKQAPKPYLPKPQSIIDIQSDAVKALIELNKTRGQGQNKSHPLIKNLAFRMLDMGYNMHSIAECIGVSYSLVVKWSHKRRKLRKETFDTKPAPAPVVIRGGQIEMFETKRSLIQRIRDWFVR